MMMLLVVFDDGVVLKMLGDGREEWKSMKSDEEMALCVDA